RSWGSSIPPCPPWRDSRRPRFPSASHAPGSRSDCRRSGHIWRIARPSASRSSSRAGGEASGARRATTRTERRPGWNRRGDEYRHIAKALGTRVIHIQVRDPTRSPRSRVTTQERKSRPSGGAVKRLTAALLALALLAAPLAAEAQQAGKVYRIG